MAVVRFAEGQQRSGAIGGSVYSHNRFGQYIRTRSIPVNPLSASQFEVRQAMLAAQAAWAAATSGVKASWAAYADAVSWKNRFGDPCKLTDQEHFLRCASLARYVGLGAAWDGYPVEMRLPSPDETVAIAAEAGGPTVTITFGSATDPWKTAAGNHLLLFIGRERGPGVNYYGGPFRYLGRINGASTPPTSPQTFTNPFGDFSGSGNKVWLRWRTYLQAAGLSEPAYGSAIITEP